MTTVKYTIEFSGSPQDVTITTFGPANREGLVGFVQDLVDDPRLASVSVPGRRFMDERWLISAAAFIPLGSPR